MSTWLLLSSVLLATCQALRIPDDLWGALVQYATDQELFRVYFQESSFKALRGAIGKEIIKREDAFVFTLTQLQHLSRCETFLCGHPRTVLLRQIERLQPLQSRVDQATDVWSCLKDKDLRGIAFSDTAEFLDLSSLNLRSVVGIHFGDNLRTLRLCHNNFSSLDGAQWPKRHLRRLVLSGNPIEGTLHSLPATLNYLNVENCKNITAIVAGDALRHLSLIRSGITSPSQLKLGNATRLEYVCIGAVDAFTLEWARFRKEHRQRGLRLISR